MRSRPSELAPGLPFVVPKSVSHGVLRVSIGEVSAGIGSGIGTIFTGRTTGRRRPARSSDPVIGTDAVCQTLLRGAGLSRGLCSRMARGT